MSTRARPGPGRGPSPRVRGRGARGLHQPPVGRSIPRVRGREYAELLAPCPPRNIPARAGPSRGRSPRRCRASEHPRACGAERSSSLPPSSFHGTSPRMRGRVDVERAAVGGVRNIPARAGPRCGRGVGTSRRGEHPRACGAEYRRPRRRPPRCGTSPRVRGREQRGDPLCALGGNIPARAGPSAPRCTGVWGVVEHPRACGAEGDAFEAAWNARGTSPRVRGRVRRGPLDLRQRRNIPARAGPSPAARGSARRAGEHPRACGAESARSRSRSVRRRNIPARAGPRPLRRQLPRTPGEHPRACGAEAD